MKSEWYLQESAVHDVKRGRLCCEKRPFML